LLYLQKNGSQKILNAKKGVQIKAEPCFAAIILQAIQNKNR